jgi:DNA-binding NarL/FixJ family response regulator
LFETDNITENVNINRPYRVLLTETRNFSAKLLGSLFQKVSKINYVGNVSSTSDLIEILSTRSIDVIIFDLNLPGLNVEEFFPWLFENFPRIKVIIYTDIITNIQKIQMTMEYGASGLFA